MEAGIVCRGVIVRCVAGRDKHRLFAITGACTDGSPRVMIADGRLHPLSNQKKKSLRHLAVLAAADGGDTSFLSSDSSLSAYLDSFERDLTDSVK